MPFVCKQNHCHSFPVGATPRHGAVWFSDTVIRKLSPSIFRRVCRRSHPGTSEGAGLPAFIAARHKLPLSHVWIFPATSSFPIIGLVSSDTSVFTIQHKWHTAFARLHRITRLERRTLFLGWHLMTLFQWKSWKKSNEIRRWSWTAHDLEESCRPFFHDTQGPVIPVFTWRYDENAVGCVSEREPCEIIFTGFQKQSYKPAFDTRVWGRPSSKPAY
jgi:hypothetical protein